MLTQSVPDLTDLDVSFQPSQSGSDQAKVRKRRADAGVPRRKRITQEKLVHELLTPWASAAALVAPACPTVATIMAAEGESTITAFVELAANYPKFYAALTKAAQIGPAAKVAQTMMLILVALMLDTRRISPDHPVAGVTGLAALTRQTHPEWYGSSSVASPESAVKVTG